MTSYAKAVGIVVVVSMGPCISTRILIPASVHDVTGPVPKLALALTGEPGGDGGVEVEEGPPP